MKKMRQGKKDIKSMVILIAAILVFAYALVRLGIIFLEYGKGQQSYNRLEEFAGSTKVGTQGAGSEGFSVDFEELKKINPDIAGWIRFENMDISYPIVQGKDNDYYLTHSFYKEELKCGSIFIEAENKADFSDDNTFVYGHNMKDKSMFAKLNEFKEEQIYRENPEFVIYTEDGIYQYSIFSCYVADVTWDSFTYQFGNGQQYEKWLQTAKERSLYDTGITPKQEQKTVTLMTCTPAGDNYRFLVHGVLTKTTKKTK